MWGTEKKVQDKNGNYHTVSILQWLLRLPLAAIFLALYVVMFTIEHVVLTPLKFWDKTKK